MTTNTKTKKLLSKLRREFVTAQELTSGTKRKQIEKMSSLWFSTFPQNVRTHFAPVLVMRGGLLFYEMALSFFSQPLGLTKAEAASSETNIASKSYSALSDLLPKTLEEKEGYHILLPSSRLWLDSGIQVTQDDIVRIRISGGVNTAISQLVLHDIEQTPSPYPWTHLPNDNISAPEVKIRATKELIQPNAWYRDVLMFVAKDENEVKEILQNPKAASEDRIINITPSATSWMDCETSLPITRAEK